MTVRDGNGNEAHDGDAVRGNEDPGVKGSPEPPPRGTVFKNIRLTDDQDVVDALYGLEPVFEPGGPEGRNLTEFVAVQCPYCGETFETAVDLSAGSFSYVEDCHVCCQPIELAGEVDDAGALVAVTASRGCG